MPERWITASRLAADCAAAGLAAGDTVMVHASLRTVGEIMGGPDVLIGAILGALGPSGTMMVYIGCQSPFDEIGRGMYTADEERSILEHCPAFDPQTARASREFGALAELFRTYPGVRCSAQVSARMAARGRGAEELLRVGAPDPGLGRGSPLEHLCAARGKVLLIGSDLDEVTLLHYAEALAPVSGKRMFHLKFPLIAGGRRRWVDVDELDSSTGIRDWDDHRLFAHIVERFIEQNGIARSTIGNAPSYLLSAADLVGFAVPIITAEAERLDHGAG